MNISKYCNGILSFNILDNTFYVDTLDYGIITIPEKFLNKAFIHDEVLLKIKKDTNIGFVQKVLTRSESTYLIGEIDNEHIKPWNIGYYKDFYIGQNNFKKGDIVSFKYLNDWKDKSPNVIDVLLVDLSDTTRSNKLFVRYNISNKFSEDSYEDCKNLIFNYKSKTDFTRLKTISFDSTYETAISYEKTIFGYRLYYHIADCTENIRTGNSIDTDAYNKGYTIFTPDYIPILPQDFINYTSLLKGKDRQTISVIFNLDQNYTILESSIVRSIINVDRNYTLDEAYTDLINDDIYLNELYIVSKALNNETDITINKIEKIQQRLKNIVNTTIHSKYIDNIFISSISDKDVIPSSSNCSFTNVLTEYPDIFNQRILVKLMDSKKIITGNIYKMCKHLTNMKQIKNSLII